MISFLAYSDLVSVSVCVGPGRATENRFLPVQTDF